MQDFWLAGKEVQIQFGLWIRRALKLEVIISCSWDTVQKDLKKDTQP